MTINKPTTIIIHHSAVSSNKPQFEAINRYHKSLDFPVSLFGYYVGYHFVIERDGRLIIARADKDVGAHTLKGWNKKSIGVCLAGDFNREVPTEAQLHSLRQLISDYKLPYKLHKELDTRRTCPGIYLTRDQINKIGIDKEDLKKCKAINKELIGIIDKLIRWISSYLRTNK